MSESARLLVVDDDSEIRELLSGFLSRHGYAVDRAADGGEMRAAFEAQPADLVILDLMLPGESGLDLCRWLQQAGDPLVIMLTAAGEEIDRIVGLELGADDYVAKPCSPRELLARIRAVLRRAGARSDRPAVAATNAAADPESPADSDLRLFEGWRLDVASRMLTAPDGTPVELTSGEFELLLAFLDRPQRVLNRDQLLDLAHGRSALPFDRSIDVQVSRLRRKMEADVRSPKLIKTVRNGGYMLAVPVRRK